MKIKREILGHTIEIELTEQELYNAYIEQETLFDRESARDELGYRYEDKEWVEKLFADKEAVDEIVALVAAIFRELENECGTSYSVSMDMTFEDEDVKNWIEEYAKGVSDNARAE